MTTTRAPRPPVPLADCRQCGEPIVFVKLDTGSTMPVNPIPNPDGNVAARLQGRTLVGFVVSRDRLPGGSYPIRLTPHFATCEVLRAERKPRGPADTPLF